MSNIYCLPEDLEGKEEGKIRVAGILVMRDEDLYLQGPSGAEVQLKTASESEMYDLSEKDGESSVILAEISKGCLEVKGYSFFSLPLDLELFRDVLKETRKHPEVFAVK